MGKRDERCKKWMRNEVESLRQIFSSLKLRNDACNNEIIHVFLPAFLDGLKTTFFFVFSACSSESRRKNFRLNFISNFTLFVAEYFFASSRKILPEDNLREIKLFTLRREIIQISP